MKIEVYKGNWTREYVNFNKDKVFVFGDNDARIGKGGQATIRGLTNVIGLRTKRGPSKKPAAFYNDSQLKDNKSKIDEDILNIKKLSMSGKTIVFSKNGYGTGLANLKLKAPKTFEYLCLSLKLNFGFDNEKGTKWSKIPGHDEISKGIYLEMSKSNNSIIQPVNNSSFRHDLLESNLNTITDLIKSDKKIAFSQNKTYKSDSILIFVIPGQSNYLVVRVTGSYKLSSIDKKYWSLFEGYNDEFGDEVYNNLEVNDYYQTHFQYICSLEQSGRMIFKDDIFGGYDKPTVDMSKKKINDKSNKQEKTTFKYPLIPELSKGKELSTEDLLCTISDLNNEIKELKTPFFVKIIRFIKEKIKKRNLNEILTKKGLSGELSKINNIISKDNKSEYYKLVTDKYTHFLKYKKRIFKNKVDIILTFKNE